MKALSIRQPYANLILSGAKSVEIRSWETPHRGDLLICAGKTPAWPKEAMEHIGADLGLPWNFGQALCVVELYDVRPLREEDADDAFILAEEVDTSSFGWHLRRVRPVVPRPVKGKLGLFEVDTAEFSISPVAMWDDLRVKEGVRDEDFGEVVGGWQGRAADVIFDEDGVFVLLVPDSISLKQVSREHLERAHQENVPWNAFAVRVDQVEPAEPRDTQEQSNAACEAIIAENPDLFSDEQPS